MALVNNGDYQDFSYTGNVQTITLTKSGVYLLEAWGAGTSDTAYDTARAAGGYVGGYKYFEAGTTLYIVVGGSNGYNGGGSSTGYHDATYAYVSCSSGGGATHIAKVTGLLAAIGEASFCVNGNGYLIAGGAGGSETIIPAGGPQYARGYNGGAGGTGGNNGKFGQGSNHPGSGSDGMHHGCGGGAGYRGGYSVSGSGSVGGGGGYGGTNWNNGCPSFTYNGHTYSPSSSSGKQYGNGKAKITLTEVAYTITLSKNIDSNLLSVSGDGEYGDGTNVTLVASIIAQPWGGKHYRFDGWYLNNTKVSSSSSYTITVTANASYQARFVEQANIRTASNPSGAGTITGAGLYDVGTAVSLVITENEGFAFVEWDDHDTDNPRSVTVSEDIEYTAIFTSAYNIETYIVGQGSLNTTYTTSGLTITATPATHWGFVNIKVLFLDSLETNSGVDIETNLGEVIMIGATNNTYTSNPVTVTITNDVVVEVTFEYIGKTFTRYIYGIGGENDSTSRGTIIGSDPTEIYDNGTTVTVKVGSNGLCHTFQGWYATEADAKAEQNRISNSYTYSFTITEDTTLIAKFVFNYPWIPLVYDRTQADVDSKTEKAYLNYTDILRLEKDLGYMEGYYNLPIGVDLDWAWTRFIYQADFTRLINRLIALKQASEVSGNIPSHPVNSYSSLNDFEETLNNVHNTITY